MDYLKRLSRRQHTWRVATLLAMAILVAVGWTLRRQAHPVMDVLFL
jgi:hypothetical protein